MKALWFGLVVAAVGCHEDYCKDAVDYCEGNTIHFCVDNHDEPHRWESRSCGERYCLELDQASGAGCFSEPTPRPACDGVTDSHLKICDGADQISCLYGYANVHLKCPTPELCEESLTTCTVRPGTQAECATRTPTDGNPASYCDGDTVIDCNGQFAVSEKPCGTGLCHETSQDAACIATTMPDPACTSVSAEYVYGACLNASTHIACIGPYRVAGVTLICGSGTCTSYGCKG